MVSLKVVLILKNTIMNELKRERMYKLDFHEDLKIVNIIAIGKRENFEVYDIANSRNK